MTQLAQIAAAAALMVILPAGAAQTAQHAKKPVPKPEPTQQELIEYLRGKLLVLSPRDGVNDNIEVSFDPATNTLSVTGPNGRCDHFLGALDVNSLVWDTFDPGDEHNSSEELLRLTVISVSGKAARACYDKQGQADPSLLPNRSRLLFLPAEGERISDFKAAMTKTMKNLIVLSGGAPEKKLF